MSLKKYEDLVQLPHTADLSPLHGPPKNTSWMQQRTWRAKYWGRWICSVIKFDCIILHCIAFILKFEFAGQLSDTLLQESILLQPSLSMRNAYYWRYDWFSNFDTINGRSKRLPFLCEWHWYFGLQEFSALFQCQSYMSNEGIPIRMGIFIYNWNWYIILLLSRFCPSASPFVHGLKTSMRRATDWLRS